MLLLALVLGGVFVLLIGWRATLRAGGVDVVCAAGGDLVQQRVEFDPSAAGQSA